MIAMLRDPDPTLARIPVVVLTAKSLTDAERRLLARTAAGVLQKGSHHLADVAALVLRAAAHARRLSASWGSAPQTPQVGPAVAGTAEQTPNPSAT
jgi:DNA-binding NarL/FixJ family response regulator